MIYCVQCDTVEIQTILDCSSEPRTGTIWAVQASCEQHKSLADYDIEMQFHGVRNNDASIHNLTFAENGDPPGSNSEIILAFCTPCCDLMPPFSFACLQGTDS